MHSVNQTFKRFLLKQHRSGHAFTPDQTRFVEVVLSDWNCPDILTWEQLESYVRVSGGDEDTVNVAADLFTEWKGFL